MLQSNIQYVFFYSNYIKKAFTRALRAAFEDENVVPPQYRFSRKHTDRQIFIWRDYPRRNLRFPQIVVTTHAGDLSMTYVGEEYSKKELENPERVEGPTTAPGYLFSGFLKINVEVEVVCKSLRDIENIFDLTAFFVRHVFRKNFYENNIAYTDVSQTGQVFEDGLYKNKLMIVVHTEYNNIVPESLYEAINKVFVGITPVTSFE